MTITIDALTPHFYPTLYLKKVEQSSAAGDLRALKFPSAQRGGSDQSFGENPFYQLNAKTFAYTFVAAATQEWTYYTMAVYQHTWGLTAQRKSEYQIRVAADLITQATYTNELKKQSPQVSSAHTASSAAATPQVQAEENRWSWQQARSAMDSSYKAARELFEQNPVTQFLLSTFGNGKGASESFEGFI